MTESIELTQRHVMNTYNRLPVTFVRGEGVFLFDSTGRRYLDFVAGIAVVSVGHSHPRVFEAIAEQSRKLTHASNLYYTEPMARLASRLCRLLGWKNGKVFFANSGAEANECAIKLVRKWSRTKFSPTRYETIAAFGSFHGRTLETLAATGQPKKWEPFTPLPPGFVHVAYDDAAALESAVSEKTASVLMEPIQGEGGVIAPSNEYLPAVRKICDAHNLAFIADEVQTGLGRTGHWFGFQDSGAEPDVITLAKALGNGLPIGVCIARGEFAEAFQPGDHATTIGGGPVICSAAEAVLDVMEKENLVEAASQTGAYLLEKLQQLQAKSDLVEAVRGKGLLLALQLSKDVAADIVAGALEKGLLVNNVTPSALRLSPPLIVSRAQCDEAVGILEEVLV